jgi:hypothetical protein
MSIQPTILPERELYDFENWKAYGKRLGAEFRENHQAAIKSEWNGLWEIGDWLLDGRKLGKLKQRELIQEGTKASGLGWGHLKNCMVVCRAFPPERRRKGVSFTVHKLLCPLKRQDAPGLVDVERQNWLLDKAQASAANGRPVSVRDMQKYLKTHRVATDTKTGEKVEVTPTPPPMGYPVKFLLTDRNFWYVCKVASSFEFGGNRMDPDDLALHIVRCHLFRYAAEIKAGVTAYEEARKQWLAATRDAKPGDPRWKDAPEQPVFPGLEDYVASPQRLNAYIWRTQDPFEPESTPDEIEKDIEMAAAEPEDPDDLNPEKITASKTTN